jgi:hypothetical protein
MNYSALISPRSLKALGQFGRVTVAAALLVSASVPLVASAQTPKARLANQQARIQQGVKNGSITKAEYNHDMKRVNAINAERKADRQANGGKLTTAEHQQLRSQLNHSSRNIYYTKHNLNKQPGS